MVAGYLSHTRTTSPSDRGGASLLPPPGRRPTGVAGPDVDAHSFVLRALDEHLAVLLEVRTRLTAARAVRPGTRRRLVTDSATSAHRYLSRMMAVLSGLSTR